MLKGRVDKNAFTEAFKAKGIERSKDVETFLANMTGDQDGYLLPFSFSSSSSSWSCSSCCFVVKDLFSLSIIHLFNWSALIDEDNDLGQVLH